jgi:hypothetical protein
MTLRVLVSVDPGTQGSYAIFLDGELDRVARIPSYAVAATSTKKGYTQIKWIDLLAEFVRVIHENQGATFTAVIEEVGSFGIGKKGETTMGMMAVVKLVSVAHTIAGMFIAQGWDVQFVQPRVWKQFHGLKGSDKDLSRAKAKELYPWLELNTKVSADLAEAVLIGVYGCDRYGP